MYVLRFGQLVQPSHLIIGKSPLHRAKIIFKLSGCPGSNNYRADPRFLENPVQCRLRNRSLMRLGDLRELIDKRKQLLSL